MQDSLVVEGEPSQTYQPKKCGSLHIEKINQSNQGEGVGVGVRV